MEIQRILKMDIEISKLWKGRSGNDKTYFHPRATTLKDKTLLMTIQEISGSDYFHPVELTRSADKGKSWSKPELIPGFGRKHIEDGIEEGVCDVVPDYHQQTEKLIAIGHNVYYKEGRLFDTLGNFHKEKMTKPLRRFPVYNIMDNNGRWLENRQKLEFKEFEEGSIFSCGCSQKVILENGDILIPIKFGFFTRQDCMATSLLCKFDGKKITALKRGNILELRIRRGFSEPSITRHNEKFWMTIRAEDNHGYVSESSDGLAWEAPKQWKWSDGKNISMFSTQQHWLRQNGKLYLVYNRKAENNINVMRWRSPLFIAEFDTEKICLIKETEQVVFPIIGDGINKQEEVPLMGNFHTTELSENEAAITVGEMLPHEGFKGDTLLAKVTS
jgi:hypothetical protein